MACPLLRAVVASADERQLGNLSQSVKRKFNFCYADDGQQRWDELQHGGFAVPSRWALTRARIHLHVAAAAHSKDANLARTMAWRQLNYDSSPKGGVELFAIKEFIIEGQDTTRSTHQTWSLLSLGLNYGSSIDKTAALCHGIHLQCGPSLLQMRHFCHEVFVLLTDQGVEESIANAKDCLEAFMEEKPLEECSTDKWLFPNALPVLDANHLFDWVLRVTCSRLSFCSDFEVLSKALSKLLTTTSYVEALTKVLQENANDESDQHIKSLTSYGAKMIKWRYGSLHQVCEELSQAERALKAAWRPGHYRFKDSNMGKKVAEAIPHASFWLWLKILHKITAFCQTHRSWCLGCPCHEVECQHFAHTSRIFKCPQQRKSMRGPELYTHMQLALATFATEMQNLAQDPLLQDRADLRACIRHSTEALTSAFQLKFSFCTVMPWLLWRVRGHPEVAADILRSHDAAVASGRKCHRLHTRFCTQPLRQHLEVMEQGEGWSVLPHP